MCKEKVIWKTNGRRIDPLLGRNLEANRGTTAGKHINNIRAIARQPPITTIE
jgi:hypothetical protein